MAAPSKFRHWWDLRGPGVQLYLPKDPAYVPVLRARSIKSNKTKIIY